METSNGNSAFDENIPQVLCNIHSPLTEIRLYLKNIYARKCFSFGTWTSRQHLILAIQSNSETGFGESIISVNKPDISLDECIEHCRALIGKTISQALVYTRKKRGDWAEHFTEMTETALLDTAGKILKQNAVQLLGLSGKKPVNGVYVILSDDTDDIAAKTRWAVEQGKDTFIKVKLFGNEKTDCSIIRTIRKYTSGKNTYLIGDVNGGYRMPGDTADLDDIAEHLVMLHKEGLSACEDPAYIPLKDWVTLQNKVGTLHLIPDYPLRPSREAVKTIVPGMGRIYNIHPDSAGSILDAVALAHKIKQLGAQLMVGDDSLVGPAASVWQQLAVGLEAAWVEATEKAEESDFYYKAVISIPTDSSHNPITPKDCHGFGIYLNEDILKANTDTVFTIV